MTIKELNSAIERIDTDFKKLSIEDLTHAMAQLHANFKITAFDMPPGKIFYRSVFWADKPANYADIIYPPVTQSRLNRCNDKGEQVFYCSSSKYSTLFELNAQPGESYAISTWLSDIPFLTTSAGFNREDLVEFFNDIEKLGFVGKPSLKYDDYSEVLHAYLRENFIKKVDKVDGDSVYKLTNALTRWFFNQKVQINDDLLNNFLCLHYPTIKFKRKSDNFCLTKSAIDYNVLKLDRVEYVNILKEEDDYYIYKILDVAHDYDLNQKLLWENLNKTWTVKDNLEELYFVKENNDFNAYNSSGEIYAEN